MDVRLDVELHDAQLHLALLRPEEEDPVEPVAAPEADHVVVERAALVEALGQDVRLDPLDRQGAGESSFPSVTCSTGN